MKIAVINYGAGNIKSVCNALKKLRFDYDVLSNPNNLKDYDKVILPGVGAAKSAMKELKERKFENFIRNLKVPFLGICLGLQLLSDFSEEGDVKCLSVIPGKVKKFDFGSGALRRSLKVPQIGWNKVSFCKKDLLFDGMQDGEYFYFVNSYYLETRDEYVLGKTSYGVDFASVVRKGNFWAAQFHPEKSGEVGLKLLYNFCTRC